MYSEAPSLVEPLREHGYLTGAIVSNIVLKPYFGFARGFDYYSNWRNIGDIRLYFLPITHIVSLTTNSFHEIFATYRVASEINDEVCRWFEQFSLRPFFLFVNYMDPHAPYVPPAPFDSLYRTRGPRRVHRTKTLLEYRLGKIDRPTYFAYLGSQYDGEIACLDRELGKLFDRMKELGIYDSSFVIVTSDHGELLGEHDLLAHVTDMYEEALRIPLVVKFPFSGRRGLERRPIHLVDILPTVFDWCGLPLPEGLSGSPYGKPEKPIVGELFKDKSGGSVHRVLYQGPYKLMQYDGPRAAELYDLKRDPGETRDLGSERSDIVLDLSVQLEQWREKHPPRGVRTVAAEAMPPKEVYDDLKALGYIR
jgi:arylsulfatase A-like enzyme